MPLLTTEDVERIRQEEILRAEIRLRLDSDAKASKPHKTAWDFVNSTFGIWLLSAIFVSGAGAIFTYLQQQRAELEKRTDMVEKLDFEIGYRFGQVLLRLHELSDKGSSKAVLRTGATEADVIKVLQILQESPLRSVPPLYPEYEKWGLPSLIAELKRHTADKKEQERLEIVLAALVGRKAEEGRPPDLGSSAGRIVDTLMLPRWKSGAFHFTDCSSSRPFC